MLPKQVWCIFLLAVSVLTKDLTGNAKSLMLDHRHVNQQAQDSRDRYSGLDTLGGGNLLRHPDHLPNPQDHSEFDGTSEEARNVDGLGGGNLLRGHERDIDALGGGNLLRGHIRDIDALGGGNLLRGKVRDVDTLGGGNLLREPVYIQEIPEFWGDIIECPLIPTFLCLKPPSRLPLGIPRKSSGVSSPSLAWKRLGDIDPLSGTGFGVQKRIDALSGTGFGVQKRIDSLRGAGFGLQKRINSLSGTGFGLQKRPKLLSGSRHPYFGYSKRNFDEIENSGFSRFYKRGQLDKRNFDEIDRSGFSRFYKRSQHDKRNFDEIENSGFNRFYRSQPLIQ